MIYRLADNIVSPLGATTAENYRAVKAGQSALCRYEGRWGLPQAFCASLMPAGAGSAAGAALSRFELLALRSLRAALADAAIDTGGPDVVLILSTTKGNIELLGQSDVALDESALRLARAVGISTTPIVVCNACISGVAAQVLALRLLDAGEYRYAVVCGADVQSAFTVSGFQSLQVLSADACRPFDIGRSGLNLGEAAATVVYTREWRRDWCLEAGAIRNDAYHISSPSRQAEGARQALLALHADPSRLAFINAHGTATLFNDQMESVAITQAGFGGVPVNALKGYYGHTLGAAGVLETVLSMAAANDHTILATRGYEERGVSGRLLLSGAHQSADCHAFVKMISGFGGGNAAILLSRSDTSKLSLQRHTLEERTLIATPHSRRENSLRLTPADGALTDLYRQHVGDYPRYYKMDGLSRLGLVASEMLLRQSGRRPDDAAVILFNHSSSIAADRQYLATIAGADGFYPSPSVFVYTLPNIVTGEIAIRHRFHGETSFYILPQKDPALMRRVAEASLACCGAPCVLTGWIDYEDDLHYEADLHMIAHKTL